MLLAKGDAAAAEALFRESLAVDRRVFGDAHAEYAVKMNNLATAVEAQGRLAEAQTMLEECLRVARPVLSNDHPRVLVFATNLARVQIARGHGADVESDLRHVLSARQRIYPAGDWRIGQAQSLLGASLMAQSRYADAEPLMLAADEGLKPVAGAQARERAANRARLRSLYLTLGRPQQADAYR